MLNVKWWNGLAEFRKIKTMNKLTVETQRAQRIAKHPLRLSAPLSVLSACPTQAGLKTGILYHHHE
jgi:hypothetical protein